MTVIFTKKRLINLSLVCCFFCISIHAQEYDENFKQLKERYPDARLVHLVDHKTVEIEITDGDLFIKQSYELENIYMDDRAKGASEDYLKYNNFTKIENIEATSYPYIDGKYEKFKVKDFTQKDVLTSSFYDDIKQIDFVFPQLGTASKTKLSYDEILKNPRFLNTMYFGYYNPIVHKKVEFIVDNGVKISFKSFNTDGFDIQFTTDKKRNETIYTWEVQDVSAFKYENSSANARDILPHIIPIINSYTIDGKKTEVLGEVKLLYNWYYDMIKDINQKETSAELIEKAKALTKDKSTDLEKVEAIYYWVQQEIKYIAFEHDLGGFIPREANDIFNKRFGDCKDNSSILSVMLKAIGLKGNLTWVGTREIPYTYQELPTPQVDNHMILTYIDQNEKIYYLDATGRYHNIDLPTSFIQGKEVLIGLDQDNYQIEKVPFVSAKRNLQQEKTKLVIEGNDIIGKSNISVSAYPKIDLFNRRENVKKNDLMSFYRNYFKKENNKFIITDFQEENLYSYDKTFQLSYDFNIENYCDRVGDELFINMNLNDPISSYKTNKEFVYDIEIEYMKTYTYENRLSIPENYKISYLPENFSESNTYFDAEISYEINDNEIVYQHQIELKFIKLNSAEQKEVNKAIERLQKNLRELLILKKI